MKSLLMNIRVISVLAASLACAAADAQSRQVPAPSQDRPVAIMHATVHNPPASVDGEDEVILEDGYVLFEKGRITEIGVGTPEDLEGFDVLDARGLHVYPGLVAGPSQLGLLETGQVEATDDRRELDNEHPEVTAWVAVNPDSDLLPVARSAGILTALVFPTGGTIGGQPSAIRLDGWTTEDLVMKKSLGVVINWPLIHPVTSRWSRRGGGEQSARSAERIAEINAFFDDAAAWNLAREHDETTPFNARFAAMKPVLDGERPVFIDASRTSQIESAVAWAKGRNLEVVIVGGSAAYGCAELLAREGVPVILRGTLRLPLHRHDRPDAPFRNPAELHEAGVLFAIGNAEGEPAHERSLAHQAAMAAAHGLPRGAALRAVTLSPAEIIGLEGDIGSVEPGKCATLLVTTGNPLEITSETLVAFIDGRRIDLDDRQKTLMRKYREKYRQLGLIETN
jgi:imidazolonepropionase-like amidohydrolase